MISLVIPARNEAENIPSLVMEIRKALKGQYDYEIIYVDDGSTDNTIEVLKHLRNEGHPQLRIICHQTTLGQSSAIMTGVKASKGKWIVTLDADGQNDPADIPLLLQCALDPLKDNRLHLITGYRKKRKDTWITRISSRIANKVRSEMLGDKTPDTGCGLKVVSREAFLNLPYFDHMHRFLPALIQRQHGKIKIVEVNHRPRNHGRSNYGVFDRLWVGIVDLFGVMWLQRRTKIPTDFKEL